MGQDTYQANVEKFQFHNYNHALEIITQHIIKFFRTCDNNIHTNDVTRKPDEIISIIERCSPAPFIELFARGDREGWTMWGNQATSDYDPTWSTYKNHTIAHQEVESAYTTFLPHSPNTRCS